MTDRLAERQGERALLWLASRVSACTSIAGYAVCTGKHCRASIAASRQVLPGVQCAQASIAASIQALPGVYGQAGRVTPIHRLSDPPTQRPMCSQCSSMSDHALILDPTCSTGYPPLSYDRAQLAPPLVAACSVLPLFHQDRQKS